MIEYLNRLSPTGRPALLAAWRLSTVEGIPVAIDAEHLLDGVVSIHYDGDSDDSLDSAD